MWFLIINFLTYAISSNSVFPPIGNIYKTEVYMPFAGKQYIEYKRFEKLKSYIHLSGIINCNSTLIVNEISKNNNYIYSFTFDNQIIDILKKYKCDISEPIYDINKDIVTFKICLYLINYKKKIILKKI